VTRFWHPFADMAAVQARGELSLERGEGYRVFDTQGRRYLDATASLWYAMIGHGRGEIGDAVAAQMRTLEAYSTFGDLTNPVVDALIERIAALAPVANSTVFLTSGGSDSIETATKMARRFWQLKGEHGRTVLIRREKAYHGMHTAGTSLAGIPGNIEGYGGLLSDVVEVPWDDVGALHDAVQAVGPERIAAFFCEPVVGAGGIFAPPPGYLEKAQQVCRDTGVLFIVDEVITAFGRTGAWFASERWELEPDLITCAKGITSGYLPLGAVIAAPRVWEAFWTEGAGMFRHGYTYTGHASVAAAALANLDIIEREGLIECGAALEGALERALKPLEDHAMVSEVRAGCGAMAAVQIDPAQMEADPTLALRVVPACRDAGIMTRMLATGAIQVSPPLMLDAEGVAELAAAIRAAMDELEAQS
jgi:putrescine aminotransferase